MRLRDKVDEEGKEIQTLLLDIRQHTRLVKLHLDEIQHNPESSQLVNISIILAVVLFFVGVIYPLSFLPTDPTKQIQLSLIAFFTTLFSLKGFMLASASLIFLAITGTFWYVNGSLKYVPDEIERMRNATFVGNYSRYFEIREANVKAVKEWREEHDQLESRQRSSGP